MQVPLVAEATVDYERASYQAFSLTPLPSIDLFENNCAEAFFGYSDGSGGDDYAGWGFIVTTWSGDILYERWGRVVTDPTHPCFLGAEIHSNNSGELSGLIELLMYLFYESPLPWRDMGIVLGYDSTYSVGVGTGAWRPNDNAALIRTALSIWETFDVDKFPILV